MQLEEIFKQYGYRDLIDPTISQKAQLDIEYLYEINEEKFVRPIELIGAYLSKNGDELFLVLDGTGKNIHKLCQKWDQKLEVFTNFASEDNGILSKLRYNIVQLILCTEKIEDRSEEGSLWISRKILLPVTKISNGKFDIIPTDAIEIPFCLVKEDNLSPNLEIKDTLKSLIPNPDEKDCYKIMTKEQKQVNRRLKDGIYKKSFSQDDYNHIKEWLEKNVD